MIDKYDPEKYNAQKHGFLPMVFRDMDRLMDPNIYYRRAVINKLYRCDVSDNVYFADSNLDWEEQPDYVQEGEVSLRLSEYQARELYRRLGEIIIEWDEES